jgi:hypothetical protein
MVRAVQSRLLGGVSQQFLVRDLLRGEDQYRVGFSVVEWVSDRTSTKPSG